ncbi:hypothetical protein Riv7116_5433 [Rivularia sp. PCC 7116]|uniref:hypothetical protein n=1 Tax=Rivularia sp. PCC 7116 TaxID=373994 RepID=UPI00029F488E|nr:hypothetical protein [Rivularia sp. PCC 7116]AFY57809.1 hypothetical protein Riv7116_5433 [Rivularia sp. PCC 7116]
MTLSARRKLVLPSAIACIAVFAAMTVPLAIFGDKQVRINIEEESFFYGRLRDVAAPYVLLATVLSCGTGISVAALIGWQQTTQKSLNCKNELSKLKVHLQDKEELIEQFKFSDSRLQVSGLTSFLNGQNSQEVAPQPVVVTNSESVSKLNANKSVDAAYFSANTQDVAEDFSDSLPNDISSQTSNNTINSNAQDSLVNEANVNEHSEIEALQQQMKDMMSRIEQLQTKTKSVPIQDLTEKAPENVQAYYSSAD